MNEIVQLLTAARALIDTPSKWHQGSSRADEGGICIMTALCYAYGRNPLKHPDEVYWNALKELRRLAEVKSLVEFNDHPKTQHSDVMNLIDNTIIAVGSSNGES